jgi:hypothetical protein
MLKEEVLFKNSILTSQKTHSLSITKTSRNGGIIVVYFANHTK